MFSGHTELLMLMVSAEVSAFEGCCWLWVLHIWISCQASVSQRHEAGQSVVVVVRYADILLSGCNAAGQRFLFSSKQCSRYTYWRVVVGTIWKSRHPLLSLVLPETCSSVPRAGNHTGEPIIAKYEWYKSPGQRHSVLHDLTCS